LIQFGIILGRIRITGEGRARTGKVREEPEEEEG
jgi:hypothetical protein